MKFEITVSVCVATYNQESYIGECLESLVNQETQFLYEIIVGEDCSTDKTRDVIEEYALNYPDLIVRNYQNINVGAVKNIISSYKMARGKYICHIDGDDYALPGKLQLQATVLDKNTDCVICTHEMIGMKPNGECLNFTLFGHKKVKNTIMDLYETLPFFAHSSKMFRNDLKELFWDELHPQALDIEIHAKQSRYGLIYHINKAYGVYRIGVGVSSGVNKVINPLIVSGNARVYEEALSLYDNYIIKRFYAKSLMNFAYQSAVIGDTLGFVEHIKRSIIVKVISLKQLLMVFFILFPRFSVFICQIRNNLRFRS